MAKDVNDVIDESTDSGDVTRDDKLWAALCWVPFVGWIISILVLVVKEKNTRPFIKYHAAQSLVLNAVAGVVGVLLAAVIIGCFILFTSVIYSIYLAIQAYQGEWVEIPFITEFCKNQGWG
jgi:uncharacterized membrane protein